MTPGVADQEKRRNPRVEAFSVEYRAYSDRNPNAPKLVSIKGILKIKDDFRRTSASRGNGLGYGGVFRAALIVNQIEEARP